MSELGAEAKAAEARAISASREIRRRRARRLAIGFAVWVGIPTLIAAIYYGAVATGQYDSVALMTVESSEHVADPGKGLDAFLPREASSRDLSLAREYIRSRAMLDALIQKHGFLAHYQDPAIDRWSRLPEGASREATYAYFHDKVMVDADAGAGTLTLRVRAFAGDKAAELARAIIGQTEGMMNQLGGRAQRDQLARSEAEVTIARTRFVKAANDLATASGAAAAELQIERDLAHKALEAALAGHERSRAEASRLRRYLIPVAEPSRPDQATYPRRLWNVGTVFATALALAGVISLLIGAVREHAKF